MPFVGLLPAIAVMAGALCGIHSQLPPRPWLLALPLVCVAAGVSWRGDRRFITATTLAIGFFCGAFVLAVDARETALRSTLRVVLDSEYGGFLIETPGPAGAHDPVVVRAVLAEDAALRADFATLRAFVTTLSLRGQWWDAHGGVTLSVGGTLAAKHADEWRAGRTIEAPVVFRRPARYLNDGVPNLERDLALDGTTLFGSIKSGLLVRVRSRGSAVDEVAARARAYFRGVIARWIAPRDPLSGAIVAAVLIGDRTGMPDDVRERLQAAGTYHVIAISGGNIAVLVLLIVGALMLVGIHGRPAALVSILILLVYAQVVVGGPSVWRATLMALIHLGARALDHRTPTWHAAAVAAAVMVLARPLDVQDPGFVLTFGATAALLTVAELGRRALPRRGVQAARSAARDAGNQPRALPQALRVRLISRGESLAGWCAASLVASTAVEIALFPVAAQTFSRVTSAGVVLNLLAVPLMGVVQGAGILTSALDAVGFSASLGGWIAHQAAHALVESARLVEIAPWLTRRVASPGLVAVLLYYAALTAVLVGPRSVRVAGGIGLLAAMAVIGLGLTPGQWWGSSSRHGVLRLTVLDVGQGESMLLESAGSNALLIDAGGAPFGSGGFDIGGRVVAPALWARGVRALEALLLTHADPDHLGGVATTLDAFPVPHIWLGIPIPRHAPSQRLLQHAARLGMTVRERRAGEHDALGSVRIRVLHPPEADWERQRVRNDDSVVLEVLHGDVALLLTGDVSADIERAILPALTHARIRVLKVAHHGSRTSSSRELLEGWRPHIALISCGRGNTFGHPAPEVLRRLDAIGATVLRTDLHGQIAVETDGESLRLATFTGWQP